MLIVYLSGPYTGETTFELLQNIRDAEDLAAILWEEGFVPLCPHLNSAFFDGLVPHAQFLEGYLLLLQKAADAVYAFGDWHNSAGASDEIAHAEELGIPVFEELQELNAWRMEQENGNGKSMDVKEEACEKNE